MASLHCFGIRVGYLVVYPVEKENEDLLDKEIEPFWSRVEYDPKRFKPRELNSKYIHFVSKIFYDGFGVNLTKGEKKNL